MPGLFLSRPSLLLEHSWWRWPRGLGTEKVWYCVAECVCDAVDEAS